MRTTVHHCRDRVVVKLSTSASADEHVFDLLYESRRLHHPQPAAASPIHGPDNVDHLALHLDVLGGDGHVLMVAVTDFDLIVEATPEPGEIYEVRSSAKKFVAASGGSGSEKWNP
jgi:hypothetical protein